MPIDPNNSPSYAPVNPVPCSNSRKYLSTMDLPTTFETSTPSRRVLTIPFCVAVILLGITALLTGPLSGRFNLKVHKLPIPLNNSLSALDSEALAPYRVIDRAILQPAIVEALGTDQYLSWVLEDTSVGANDPLRRAKLFVTYYTGGGNLVPHTPDVCYLGGGYQPAQPHENIDLKMDSIHSFADSVPVRVCTFVKTAVFNRREVSVVYTFRANRRFTATRTGVRLIVNDPRDTHSFFSKVEVGFPGASRAESIAGAQKLFDRVLPILLRDHWPSLTNDDEVSTTHLGQGHQP